MKTIPMIFNQAMVTALLEGRKTVTRRPVRASTLSKLDDAITIGEIHSIGEPGDFSYVSSFAPAQKGDLIWGRETFCMGRIFDHDSGHPASDYLYVEQCKDDKNHPIYKQQCLSDDIELEEVRWTPSIHMPRRASRLTLRVTDVRIERVREITAEQAIAEGFSSRPCFAHAWKEIYGRNSWDDNQWVWTISFEVIQQNVDKIQEAA